MEWWARKTFGFEAQSREILAFTRCIVAGWKSFRGSRVEITTCALGKVEEAFSITPFSAVATLSCCALRSFVPVCIIMWLGDPSLASDRRSRARWVFGHQSLDTLCLGKSFFSSIYFPFESISSTICVLCLSSVGVGGLSEGLSGWLTGGGVQRG